VKPVDDGLHDSGTLKGRTHVEVRGDGEMFWREALRRAGKPH
jgi:hypothetical protein